MNYTKDYIHSEQAKTRTALKMVLMSAVFFIALVFADPSLQAHAAGETALVVTLDGTVAEEFTLEQLEQLASDEGNREYSFSSWDKTPEFSIAENVKGPTVDAVLKAAGVRDSVTDKGTVSFIGSSGGEAVMTGKQLFGETRFFYPEGGTVVFSDGIIPEKAYEGESEVSAVISTETDDGYGLYAGQAAPNDINGGLFIKDLAAGGRIEVSTKAAPQAPAVSITPESSSYCDPGTEINIKAILTDSDDYRIYYTFEDDAKADYGCPLSNYVKPVIPDVHGKVTLKIVVKEYGKQDRTRKCIYSTDAVTVRVNGEVRKIYRSADLDKIPDVGPYTYSGFNSYPSFDTVTAESCKNVETLIDDATGMDVNGLDPDYSIVFTGSDNVAAEFTFGQLFMTDRYYFPETSAYTDGKGVKVPAGAYEKKEPVPVIIDNNANDGTLRFGQTAPSDQNFPESVKYMLSGGYIDIFTETAPAAEPVTTSPASGEIIKPGTSIEFLPFPATEKDARSKAYYIVDPDEGTVPGYGDDFYIYSAFNWPGNKDHVIINPPVLSEPGVHKISVKVSAYGKRDSEVREFTYLVSNAGEAGLIVKATAYDKAQLKWNDVSDASGYRIYRKAGSSAEVLRKTLGATATTFTDTGLKTGTNYTYRVCVIAGDKSGTDYVFDYSDSVSVKTALSKPSLTVKAGKKKAVLKWKKISGASGYVIYRSTKKSSGYKAVKTISKGSTVSFINKKLKSKKTYYYKIRAYRNVDGKKIYSSYSAVKKGRAK